MIVVHIMGGLGNQIAQYVFGRSCADRLGVPLKLDISSYQSYTLHAYCLGDFALQAELASEQEIASAKAGGIVAEKTLLFDSSIPPQVRDGVYLQGYWGDYRYGLDVIDSLRQAFQPNLPMAHDNLLILEKIQANESVSLHIRRGDYVTNPNCLLMPLAYYQDALREVLERVPGAHVFVFSDDIEWAATNLGIDCPHTFVRGNDASRNVDDLQLMRSCRHHIIANSSFSFWAAMLGENGGFVVAPQQYFRPGDPYLIQVFGQVDQPVWPPAWIIVPLRRDRTPMSPVACIAGGYSAGRPIRVGVWNYYEQLTTDGFLFKNANASIGHDLLKPWCDLYAYGRENGIEFLTLDQVAGPEALDAVVFMDRPRMDNPMVARLLDADIAKYLCIFETEVIKPDNWDPLFHARFDRVFSWSDAHVDHQKVIKLNFAIDTESAYDIDVLKSAFCQRKLCTLIAGAKMARHPNELYSERVRAIHWFEAHAPGAFDLYGVGWNAADFPSYRGAVQDKLATLSRYRFAICYENAQGFPGYITEKILDCFRAGVVPVYLGAPNIAQWIPRDCFIDREAFGSQEELHEYLAGMDAASHAAYLERIRSFLASAQAYAFSTECFITTLTSFIARDVKARRGECPDVTVAIPTYNYGRFLTQALESALSCGVDKLEVLVLDNASTDETSEVLARFSGDPRLRVMRNTRNIGGPLNWNNALRMASGRYVAMLSADDYFLPGHLRRMVSAMDAHPSVSLAYCPCIWVDAAGNSFGVKNHSGHAATDYVGGRNEVADLLRFDCYITPSAALIRRSVFESIGALDYSLHGAIDWDLWIRIAEKAPDFAFFKEALVAYRIHPGQDTVTQTARAYTLRDHINILWNVIERGGLPLCQGKAAEIFALLKARFESFPRDLVAHLEPHIHALERILSGVTGLDIGNMRARAEGQKISTSTPANIPLVSVIVPTYNRPEFLERCLASILGQSHANLEIIVVNDAGSPVEAIIRRHNHSGRIYYLSLATNKGAAAARNAGLRLAQGDYITFLDDDDEYLPDHVSILAEALSSHSQRFAYSRAEYLVETGPGQVVKQQPFSQVEYSRDMILVGNFIPTPTWMFERALLEEAGLFDEAYKAWEDWEWLIRASARTDFLFVPRFTVQVHQRPNDAGHLGVKHRPEMRRWVDKVYAKHPSPTPEIAASREVFLKSLFPAVAATSGHASGPEDGDLFALARQGALDIIGLINGAGQLVETGHPDQGAALYLLWLAHAESPLKYAAAFNLGCLQEKMGAFQEAEQAFMSTLAYNPKFAQARYALAVLLERRGAREEARTHWGWICSVENGIETSDPGLFQNARVNLQRLLQTS